MDKGYGASLGLSLFLCLLLFIIFPQSRALLNAHEGRQRKSRGFATSSVGNDGRTETKTLETERETLEIDISITNGKRHAPKRQKRVLKRK